MPWLYKRGKLWWIGWRHGGKQFLRTTGQTDKGEAEKELAKFTVLATVHKVGALTDEFYHQLTGNTVQKVTLRDYLDAWLAESKASVTPRTSVKYRQVRNEFLAFTEADKSGLLLSEVTTEHVKAFLAKRRETISNTTVAGFRRILRSVFLQAQEEGKITVNPVLSANRKVRGRGVGKQQTERRPFTLEEIRDLHKLADPFWQWMILAAFFTGQRMGDLVTLQRRNVDLSENVIRLVSRKTDTRVVIPIAGRLREEFERFLAESPNDYYWPEQAARYVRSGASSFSQEFYELMTKAGMVPARDSKKKTQGVGRSSLRDSVLGFHNIRHTFVTNLKISGSSQATAKALAGHRTDAVSDAYSHMPLDVLSEAINKLPEFR